MTDNDLESISCHEMDNDVNQMLQYDDSDFNLQHDENNEPQIQHDLNLLLPESKEIMTDWTCAEIKIDEINSENLDNIPNCQLDRSSSVESLESFYNKPEADQSEAEQILSANVIDVMKKD